MQLKETKFCASATRLTDPRLWVAKYTDYLHSFAVRRLNNQDQAKDLVQDTFLSGLENLGNFRGLCTEKTWLTSILKNKIIDVYRKKSPKLINLKDIIKAEQGHQSFINVSNNVKNISDLPAINCSYQDDVLVNKELGVALQNCIQKLPALWLSVFSMKYIDDRSTKSICGELKVTPAYFWTIIHRSKHNLQASLKKNFV